MSLDRSGEGAGEDDAYDAEGELHGCDVDDGNELKLWSCCRWVFGFCVGGIGNWMLRFFLWGSMLLKYLRLSLSLNTLIPDMFGSFLLSNTAALVGSVLHDSILDTGRLPSIAYLFLRLP